MTERNTVNERSFHLQCMAQKVILLLTRLSWAEAHGKGIGWGGPERIMLKKQDGSRSAYELPLHSPKLHQSSAEQAGYCCVRSYSWMLMERHRKDVYTSDLHCSKAPGKSPMHEAQWTQY